MATKTVATRKRRAWTTTVFVKQLMAVSGFVFVFFLLFHSYGNLKMFLGQEAYDHYAHWLKEEAFVPIFPHGGFIWVFRAAMVLMLVIHIWAAAVTWKRSRRARRSAYVVKRSAADAYAARTMRMTGVLLFFLIVFHILHFTALAIQIGGDYHALTPYERMIVSFTPDNWASVAALVVYTAAVAFLSFHVWHGAFSALATLGAARTGAQPFLRGLAALCGLALLIGFLAPPYAIAFGFIS